MTPTLSTNQVELNCRRIYYYEFSKLVADEFGTLHHPFIRSWVPYSNNDPTITKIGAIPLSEKRIKNIKPAVLATLEGICLDMIKQKIPICFFMLPVAKQVMYVIKAPYLQATSYIKLVSRIENAPMFKDDLEIQEKVEQIKTIYNTISFGFAMLKMSDEQSAEFNLYVKHRMILLNQGPADCRSKVQKATTLFNNIQECINKNEFWDEHRQDYKPLEWVTSGSWKNAQFEMPPDENSEP